MHNVIFEVKDNLLTITVDLNEEGELSGSGKSKVVGGTGGFTPVDDTDVKVNLNVIRKP